MKIIRVAVVGCGRISDLHEMGYRGRQDSSIVAVCDTRRKAAKAKAEAWGVDKVYTDYQKVLNDPEIDLVELLTPHHLHAKMTVAACRAGKHVSVQKPMALTVAEADKMIAAADEANVVLRIYDNFVFYPPYVHAKEMIKAGEIGTPRMIRLHVNTGTRDSGWKVPLRAYFWRFSQGRGGRYNLVLDHGYHIFSLAYYLMGEVERVQAWIDQTRIVPTQYIDAPAVIMFQFKASRRYGVMDFEYTPDMRIQSEYYADDDRVEIIGDRGILFVNRCTARTVDLPPLMMFRDGETTVIDVDRVEWHDSFIDCTRHLIDVLQERGRPRLDGPTGKAVLQFSLAAHISSETGKEIRPDDVS
jgi:predicted dehydrogenase